MTESLTFAAIPHASPTPAGTRAALIEKPDFGRVPTDHMVTIKWSVDKGWHDATVLARGPFQLDPACAVLHYAQEIFEGMKAYRTADGAITLFRPEENARRFNESAERMAMPVIPEELFLAAIEELVRIDADWIPAGEGGSLYIRPFMFASEVFLGVKPASEYIFCVIASPVGAYFKGGSKAITLWVSEHYSRAAAGGTGAAKCGGNYAGSLVAQAEAIKNGCDQVVFLDAAEHRWVEELGGMNIFFVMDDGSLITPPLGTILSGITRNSIMELARAAGHDVREEPYSFDQWQADARSGKLREAFACGTAAVVAGIGEVRHAGGSFAIGNSGDGPVTTALRDQLVGIQRGNVADDRKWLHGVA
ncbi:branched-chain amino acid aminotransferase [Sphingobium phenoxybenzoativorans]|uniref:Branched-chain-amino-acid aminotransferase n=1 Tax=Sphingobium phenoxybenzoativorans TaxID=1592790 RepID=A0A975K8C1_9SPHN|nr:branched-chain amino acid aminotransferase [Sphingobium phenoxybenzoativorans]QUT06676.1 branched-chain amino acid aminotransferase [Sphingobium phenoxybenzoativorans]